MKNKKCSGVSLSVVRATAPAKIILSGEHAVVHGFPALAMAVNRFCYIKKEHNFEHCSSGSAAVEPQVKFVFSHAGYQQLFTIEQLLMLQRRLWGKYQDFLHGKCSHNEVLESPYLFVAYAYSVFLERLISLRPGGHALACCDCAEKTKVVHDAIRAEISSGVTLEISTNIPFGCGMGSSAALIVALGKVIFADAPAIDAELFLNWARDIENLQHGKSSGLDLRVAYYGTGVWMENGDYAQRDLPPFAIELVNTGRPQVTTGESVTMVRHCFEKGCFGDDFAAVARAMDEACRQKMPEEIRRCIRENHKLLCAVGVVPERVQNFVAQVEKRGLAAKISGAGAVFGDAAGVVLVTDGEVKIDSGDSKNIGDLVIHYGYEILQV